MEIENCGKHSQKLNEIMEDLIKQNREIGEQITMNDISEIDMKLFDAYQKILSMSPDGDTITKALNYLGEQVKNGTADITRLNSVAEKSAILAQKETESTVVHSEDVVAYVVSNKLILDAALYKAMEDNLIQEICSPELEDAHRETYERALKGDNESLIELFIKNQATSFLVLDDKLNSKGKKAAVLTIMAKLLDLGTPGSMMMAEKMARHFGIQDVFDQDEKLDSEAVKTRLKVLAPNVDLEEIERKDRIRALERKDVVIGTNSISFSKDISARMRKRQVTDFRRACNAAMKEGKMEEARRLARENPELLKEAQEAIEEEQKRLEKEKAGLAGLLKDDGEAR